MRDIDGGMNYMKHPEKKVQPRSHFQRDFLSPATVCDVMRLG